LKRPVSPFSRLQTADSEIRADVTGPIETPKDLFVTKRHLSRVFSVKVLKFNLRCNL